jgi:hypothetical protein
MKNNEHAGTSDAHEERLLYFIQKTLEKDTTSDI